jgi:hypothetical protein
MVGDNLKTEKPSLGLAVSSAGAVELALGRMVLMLAAGPDFEVGSPIIGELMFKADSYGSPIVAVATPLRARAGTLRRTWSANPRAMMGANEFQKTSSGKAASFAPKGMAAIARSREIRPLDASSGAARQACSLTGGALLTCVARMAPD